MKAESTEAWPEGAHRLHPARDVFEWRQRVLDLRRGRALTKCVVHRKKSAIRRRLADKPLTSLLQLRVEPARECPSTIKRASMRSAGAWRPLRMATRWQRTPCAADHPGREEAGEDFALREQHRRGRNKDESAIARGHARRDGSGGVKRRG